MSSLPHHPPFYNVFSSFQWKMPLLPRPPSKALPLQGQLTSATSRPEVHTTNHPITSATMMKPPPALSSTPNATLMKPPPVHDHPITTTMTAMMKPPPPVAPPPHLITDTMGIVSFSTNERETMKFNKRPGTVKLIPTTTPVTCVEDLHKIALPTRLNNLGGSSRGVHAKPSSVPSYVTGNVGGVRGSTNKSFSASAMKAKGSDGDYQQHRQNVMPCRNDYVLDQQDVIITAPVRGLGSNSGTFSNRKQQHFQAAQPVFQRLVERYVTAYQEPSTVVERRKAALQVMRAVQERGGTFLCSMKDHAMPSSSSSKNPHQEWAMVSNATAERFITRVLEQVARKRQPTISKMARTAQIVSQQRASVKRATASVLLHRHPVAPPRPGIQIHKKIIKKKQEVFKAPVSTLIKPVLQQGAPVQPRQLSHKKQRKSMSSTSFPKPQPRQALKPQPRQAMRPPLPRPPMQTSPFTSNQEQQGQYQYHQASAAAALDLYTTTAASSEQEIPRRVSWDKATIAAQRREQQLQEQRLQDEQGQAVFTAIAAQRREQQQGLMMHEKRLQGPQGNAVFNALDLLSSAAILDGSSNSSSYSSSDSMNSSNSDFSEDSSEETLKAVTPQHEPEAAEEEEESWAPPVSLLKQRRDQLKRISAASVTPLVNDYDDSHAKADLSYIWS